MGYGMFHAKVQGSTECLSDAVRAGQAIYNRKSLPATCPQPSRLRAGEAGGQNSKLTMAFTYFFRDLAALQAIRDRVIPELRKHRYINVWDAGCAMGPEPYSLAIIFKETLGYYAFKRLQLYATDLDEESNEFGRIIAKGIYPEESVKRIPKDILRKYFSPNTKPGYFEIADELRQCITFRKHDLRTLQPIRDNFDLIVCKNVLLHLRESERVEVIKMFHQSLSSEGFFLSEQTQKMPGETAHLFKHITANVQLFQKK